MSDFIQVSKMHCEGQILISFKMYQTVISSL